MKKIVNICIFLLIGVMILLSTSFVFTPRSNKLEDTNNGVGLNGLIGEEQDTIDILFLGDSITYSSISPMEIWEKHGISSYVLGTAGQNLSKTYKFLNKAIEHNMPKLIVLETNNLFTDIKNENFIMNNFKLFSNIFDYHDRWKTMNFKEIFKKNETKWTDDMKGFIYNKNIDPAKDINYMLYSEDSIEIKDKNLFYFNLILKTSIKNDIDLILLSCPSSRNWNYLKHNSVTKLANQNNLKFIDLNLNSEINIDWNIDTRDKGDHLNYYGANKITSYIGDYIQNNYNFKNKKSDKKYESWNKSLRKYRNIIK